ncbi:MAG: L,D-transpeptidase family protein [Algisphaera sp.]
MSLGSQNNRIGITSRGGATVRRQRQRRSLIIVLSVCALGGLYLFWPSGGGTGSIAGRDDLSRSTSGTQATSKTADPQAKPLATPSTSTSTNVNRDTPPSLPRLSATPKPKPTAQPESSATPPAALPSRPATSSTTTPSPLPTLTPSSNTRPAPSTASPTQAKPQIKPAADPVDPITQTLDTVTRGLPMPKAFTTSGDAKAMYNQADRLITEGQDIKARNVLSQVLFAENLDLSTADAALIRERLADLNQRLIFSSEIIDDDPICKPHVINGALGRIGPQYRVPYQLLMLMNDIKDARNVQAGQTIKVIQGPLHARVLKDQFIMDVFALTADGKPVFVHTFPVGLGKNDKTPVGPWKVTTNRKVKNPDWRDDADGTYYAPDNPDNPIGEYWIPIEGTNAKTKNKRGFGIHGTTDPASIGTEASRGCIRLHDADIELVFYMLTDHSQSSTVTIR